MKPVGGAAAAQDSTPEVRPIGVAALDRLELAARKVFRPFDALHDSDPVAVGAAAERVGSMPFDDQ